MQPRPKLKQNYFSHRNYLEIISATLNTLENIHELQQASEIIPK